MAQNSFEFYKPQHKRAGRMVAHSLALNDEAAWWSLAALLRCILTQSELAAMGFSVLMAQGEREALLTAEAAIFHTQRGGDDGFRTRSQLAPIRPGK